MGKKKGLANRLTKMSEEERARYLQHKADQEEEAKKRKEQLISIFMKNKIAKEEAFSRLNLAKINQHWHYILRKNKCKEMKEEIGLLRKSMDRILAYKKRTIEKLQEELELAEEQYTHNLNFHMTQIDDAITTHWASLEQYWEQYQDDLDNLISGSIKEHDDLLKKCSQDLVNLKTIVYTKEEAAKKDAKEEKEKYVKKSDDITCKFRFQLEALNKSLEAQITAIYREIAAIIRTYIKENDARRFHYVELKKLDAESAVEITSNQERITKQEKEIECLKSEVERITKTTKEEIKELTTQYNEMIEEYNMRRKQLRKELDIDNKKLTALTENSNNSIEFLTKLKLKGQHILNLAKTCPKYESEDEQLAKWMPKLEIVSSTSPEGTPQTNRSVVPDEVKKIVIEEKSGGDAPENIAPESPKFNLENYLECLMQMDNFWIRYNRVDLDYRELKQEKFRLLEENKKIRGNIRAVLEADVLDQSRVSTRVSSKSRSAPMERTR